MKKLVSELREDEIIITQYGRRVRIIAVTELPTGDYELWWRSVTPDPVIVQEFCTYLATARFEVIDSTT